MTRACMTGPAGGPQFMAPNGCCGCCGSPSLPPAATKGVVQLLTVLLMRWCWCVVAIGRGEDDVVRAVEAEDSELDDAEAADDDDGPLDEGPARGGVMPVLPPFGAARCGDCPWPFLFDECRSFTRMSDASSSCNATRPTQPRQNPGSPWPQQRATSTRMARSPLLRRPWADP